MIQIEINNSYSQIKGMTPEIYRELRKVLSYSPPAAQAYYSRFKPRPTYLIDTKGFFPTGLLERVQDHLRAGKALFQIKDLRTVPASRRGMFTMRLK